MTQTRAAEVLQEAQQSGRLHDERHDATTNLTVIPATSNAGCSRAVSHIVRSVRPMSCHPPGDSRG